MSRKHRLYDPEEARLVVPAEATATTDAIEEAPGYLVSAADAASIQELIAIRDHAPLSADRRQALDRLIRDFELYQQRAAEA